MSRACILFIVLTIAHTLGQIDRKSSLTFVIDVTTSMKTVIDTVKHHANEIFDAVLESNASYIENFVLVTFADIDYLALNVNNVTDTKDRDEFKDSLKLELVRGGTCPENSMSGILTGIENSAPGSTIYIFTDASAQDYAMCDIVKDKAQRKEIKLVFILTGKCSNKKYIQGYEAYEKLARATSGQVFNLYKNTIEEIIKYILDSIESRRIHLAAKSFPPGKGHTLNYTTDHDTSDTTISLSCSEGRSITVRGPDGKKVELTNLINLEFIMVSKVNETILGNHTVTIDCKSDSRVVITAKSTIQFIHRFSRYVPSVSSLMNDTTVKPSPDGKTYLTIKISGDFQPQAVKLIDGDDSYIPGYTMQLKTLDHPQHVFITSDAFKTPSSEFRIVVTGMNLAYNETILRIGTTLLEPQSTKFVNITQRKPSISIERGPKIDVELDTSLQLKCSVNAYPKPTITWETNGKIIETDVYDYEVPYDYVSVHKIPKVQENATFTCTANNSEGIDKQSVVVETKMFKEAPIIDKTTKAITYQEGTNASISCRFKSGIPKPTIQWFYKDSSVLVEINKAKDQDNLSLGLVNRTQKGTYKCVAKNEMGSDSMELILSVEYPPKLDSTFETITVKSDEEVTLSCPASGVPEPVVEWRKADKPITGVEFVSTIDNRLKFIADFNDRGVYKCNLKNYLGSDSKIFFVEVEKSPTVYIKETGPIDAEYGEPLNITCEVLGYPIPKIVWISNKAELKAEVKEKTPFQFLSYLSIDKVTENATYQCKANNSRGDDEKKINVHTVRKPTFAVLETPTNKDYDIAYKGTDRFVCIADAFPPAKINWYKNGNILPNDDILVSSDGLVLTIKNMQPTDAGNYTCEIKNIYHNEQYPFQISLSGVAKPKISEIPKILYVREDSKTKISCRIEEGLPKPYIQWYYKGKASDNYFEIDGNDEDLAFAPVKRTFSGAYMCVAKNVAGSHLMEFELVVEYPPTIDVNSEIITAKAGSEVTLHCEADGFPPPDVEWTKGHKYLTDSKFMTSGDHSVTFNVGVEDRGMYECSASNLLGTAVKNVSIKVEKAPSVYIEGDAMQQVDMDESLYLKCVVHGYPRPETHWIDTNNLVTLSGSTSIVSSPYEYLNVLIIDKVNQNCTYRCEAKNKHGAATASVMVKAIIKKHLDFIEKPQSATIPYEAEGKLYCKVDAYPPAIITWYKDSNVVTSKDGMRISADGSVLTFEKMQPNQEGKYVCVISNTAEVKDSIAYVTISGVGPPSIDDDVTQYAVKEGSRVSIPCSVHGKPTPTVKWTNYYSTADLATSAADHRFNLITMLSDTGNYTCTAKNIYGIATRNVRLDVYTIAIRKKGKGPIRYVKENGALKLRCEAVGNPKPNIEWFFMGTTENPLNPPRLLTTNKSSGILVQRKSLKGLLKFDRLSFSQRGQYSCVATNVLGGRAAEIFTVKVDTNVKIHNTESKIRAVDGDKVLSIYCNATGYPEPYYKWIINGVVNTKANGDTLFIKMPNKNTHSTITCTAQNDHTDPDSFKFEVVIDDYPSTNNPNSTLKAVLGHTASVACPIPHGKDDFLRWYKDDKKIHDGELVLYNINPSHAGLYTCRVSNWTKSESANVLLEVISNIRFMDTDVKTTLSLGFGDRANLNCMVVGDTDRPATVLWYFNGKIISNEAYLSFAMDQSKPGKYKCEATNDADRISRTFEVTLNECLLKIDANAKNTPLVLTHHLSWPTYKYDSGYLLLPQNQSVLIVCQSKMNFFNYDYAYAYCNEKSGVTRLEIESQPYDFSTIQCTEEVTPKAMWTKKPCHGDDSEAVKIVFEVLDKNIEVFEVCMDLSSDLPFYAKQHLHMPLNNVVPNGVAWFNDRLKYDYSKLYDIHNQVKGISRLWGSSCAYSERQLVNPLDVFPGMPQRATFTHLNVVPHWSTCASENWNKLELKVRSLIQSTNDRLIVWTGTAKNLKLNTRGYKEDVVISNDADSSNQPVSTYLWKVVQNPAKRQSLAIIQLNIPDISSIEARKYVICRDICKHIIWMETMVGKWSDASKGYTFCCDLNDFQNAFGYKVFGYDMGNILRK